MLKHDENSIHMSYKEQIDIIYDIIMASLSTPMSIDRYTENKDLILTCIDKIISKKDKLKEFKSKQTAILKPLVQDIKDCGIPMYMIKAKYVELKHAIKVKETECNGDIDIYRSDVMERKFNDLDYIFTKLFEEIDIMYKEEIDINSKKEEFRDG